MPSNFGMTEIIETVRFYEEDEKEYEIWVPAAVFSENT